MSQSKEVHKEYIEAYRQNHP
ncbi:hypothetical protein LCGC14_2748750, partial [marine sediment metagenome]